METFPQAERTIMKLDDAFSYFCATRNDKAHYTRKLADPVAAAEMRQTLEGDGESVLDAFETLVRYAAFMKAARKASRAARTLAGVTAIDFLFDGPQDYGKVWFHLWKTHRHTRHASKRIFRQLEADGVIVTTHDNSDWSNPVVTCELMGV